MNLTLVPFHVNPKSSRFRLLTNVQKTTKQLKSVSFPLAPLPNASKKKKKKKKVHDTLSPEAANVCVVTSTKRNENKGTEAQKQYVDSKQHTLTALM